MLCFLDVYLHPCFTTLTLGVIVWLVLKVLFRREKVPPGPYRLPVFGSVGFFRDFKRRRHLVLSESSQKYGSIFAVYSGSQMVVFLNGYDLIREAFVKQSSVFSDRPNWLPSLQAGLSEGKGLAWQDAAHAPSARKFALHALREFGLGNSSLQEKVLLEVKTTSDVLQQNVGQPIRLKITLKKAITNIIHDLIFSERFDYADSEIDTLILLIDEFFKGGIFIPKNFLPKFLQRFLPKEEKEFEKKQKIITQMKRYIYYRITEHERDFDGDSIRDFIDLYIEAATVTENETSCTRFAPSKGEVFRMIIDLFLAGSETTASTLDWCFMFMVKYPAIQEKCYQEILQKSECTAEHVKWSCRENLPYVEATLAEVQRLANIVPLGLPHATLETSNLQGYTIPKNTIVFANIYSCSMDPNVWESPTEFNPNRHIDDCGKFKRNDNMIPFSIGPRMCLGDTMAKLEMFVMFTNLIKRFKFTKYGESFLSATHVIANQPLSSAEHFEVIVTER